jgi:serine/threonine protein kinase
VTRFRPLRLIGHSGHSQVFVARDRLTSSLVALKVLAPFLVRELRRSGRLREAGRLCDSPPPGIVAAEIVCSATGDAACVATELLEGLSLSARLARGPVPCADAIAFCLQVGLALCEARDRGVLHGGVKPSNVFVVPDAAAPRGERALLADFGTTAPPAGLGTATDVHDLGALLHLLVTGAPYAGERVAELIAHGLNAAVAILVARAAHEASIEQLVEDLGMVAATRSFDLDPTESKLPLRPPPRAICAAPTSPPAAGELTCAFTRVEL